MATYSNIAVEQVHCNDVKGHLKICSLGKRKAQ